MKTIIVIVLNVLAFGLIALWHQKSVEDQEFEWARERTMAMHKLTNEARANYYASLNQSPYVVREALFRYLGTVQVASLVDPVWFDSKIVERYGSVKLFEMYRAERMPEQERYYLSRAIDLCEASETSDCSEHQLSKFAATYECLFLENSAMESCVEENK